MLFSIFKPTKKPVFNAAVRATKQAQIDQLNLLVRPFKKQE